MNRRIHIDMQVRLPRREVCERAENPFPTAKLTRSPLSGLSLGLMRMRMKHCLKPMAVANSSTVRARSV